MNWRNFHIISLAFETNPYKWIDIDFSLLGLNFTFIIFKRLKK